MKSALLTAVIAVSLGFAGAAQAAGDAAVGKTKATSCAMCHGPNGEGTKVGPKLAGEPAAKFIEQMNEYKSGKRDSPMMKGPTSSLSADDIANLAAYYASIK